MTDKQLEKLGILKQNSEIYPNRYWCNSTQSNITIYRSDNAEKVLYKVFNEGFEQGIVDGKRARSQQINNILNNRDIF